MHALLRETVLLLALCPFAFYLLVLYSAHRFFRRRPAEPPGDFTPPVSVLKPLHGLDRNSYENFAGFCRQNYPEYEILFGVTDEDDPTIPVIQRLIRDFPDHKIRLLVGADSLGTNDKVNKLVRMVREARYDILAISDSDMFVEPHYLRSVAQPFRDSRVGMVTCPYRGAAGKSFASQLEAIGISAGFQADVLAAWLIEGVKFALGATMVVRRNCLEEIGGFESLVNYYSDDFELGNRVAARHRVELCRWPIATVLPEQTLMQCYRHQVRWAAVTRHSRPWGHFGLALTFGLPWSVAAVLVAPSWPVAAAYFGAYLVLRTAVAWKVGVGGLRDRLLRRRLWMIPLRDVFNFIVWLSSFVPQRLRWRDSVYYVRHGRMVPAGRS